MKITYDKIADALYIEFKKLKSRKTTEKGHNVLIDFDERGNAIGIEVLNYSKLSPKQQLNVSVGQKKMALSV